MARGSDSPKAAVWRRRVAPGATGCLPASVDTGTEGVYDRVEFKYNRQGQLIWKKDQNGTIHEFDYDDLGRQTQDRVTTVGSGVDDAVLRIGKTHEVRGMVETISSYDAATSGGTVNQVVFEYDDASLLSKEYQEHAGAKNANTPHVGYNHDTSSSFGQFTKGLRPIALRYPNGRLVHYTYGTSASTADAINRIAAIKDDNSGSPGDSLAEYQYLGHTAIVQVDYPEPDLRYDLAHGTGNDPHDGPMDRFGRVTDLLWRNYGTSTDAVRIKHAYDRAGNRLYREDAVAAAHGKEFDELYTYDGVNQLVSLDRGDLNATKTAISGTPAWQEDWSLDPTGNWTAYQQKTAGTTDLDQARTHNAVNEITNITETTGPSWITPTHDRNGNTLRIMQPDDPESHYTLTWDAWNRLVKVEDGATPIANYEYDGRDFRVVKRSYDAAELDEVRHSYYNKRWQCLEERIDNSPDADRHLIWGLRYLDDLVLRDRDTSEPHDGLPDERLYALQDSNRSVAAVVNSGSAISERYSYGAFGECSVLDASYTARDASALDFEHLFAARRYESSIPLGWYRNRLCALGIGRFVSRDEVEHENRYLLLDGNPVNNLDPLGLDTCRTVSLPNPFVTGGLLDLLVDCCTPDPPEKGQPVETCTRHKLTDGPGPQQSRCREKVTEAEKDPGVRRLKEQIRNTKGCDVPTMQCKCFGYPCTGFHGLSFYPFGIYVNQGATVNVAAMYRHELAHWLQKCRGRHCKACECFLKLEIEAYFTAGKHDEFLSGMEPAGMAGAQGFASGGAKDCDWIIAKAVESTCYARQCTYKDFRHPQSRGLSKRLHKHCESLDHKFWIENPAVPL